MATITSKLGLPRPETSDTVTLANHQALIDAIDGAAASAGDLGDLSQLSTADKTNLVNAINELFQNVSDGKLTLATAIADMGQAASGSSTFAQLAAAIRNISNDANATTSQVLSGRTFYQGGTKKTGTMPNNGSLGTITPGTSNKSIPAGYTTGGTVAGDSDLVSGNIRAGVNIFGVNGSSNVINTGDANASASQILSGRTAYVGGSKVTGNMPNRGNVSQTLTSQGQSYTVPSGYHSGSGSVTANISNLSAGNIRQGATVGGVAGTFTSDANASASQILSGRTAYVNGSKVTGSMTNRGSGDYAADALAHSGNTIRLGIPDSAYYGDSAYITRSDSQWIESNIRDGVNIFGKTGNLREGKPLASGVYENNNKEIRVSGLDFAPDFILIYSMIISGAATWNRLIYSAHGNITYGNGSNSTCVRTSSNTPDGEDALDQLNRTSSGFTWTLSSIIYNGTYRWYAWRL